MSQHPKMNLTVERRATYTFYKYMRARTQRYKKNTAKVNTGDTGSGKTIKALLESYIINPKRFSEERYANSAKEFLDLVDDSKRGDVLVWDEAGVSLSSRKWHSLSNILTGEVLQTYRDKYYTVIFIAPDLSFIDVQARKLLNIFSEVQRYDAKASYDYLYKMKVDRKKGNIFFPWYQARFEGTLINLPRVMTPFSAIKKIPKAPLKAIRLKETMFKDKIRKNSKSIISMLEQEDGQSLTIYDMISEVETNPDKYTDAKGNIDKSLIEVAFGIGRTKSLQIVKFVRKSISDKNKPATDITTL